MVGPPGAGGPSVSIMKVAVVEGDPKPGQDETGFSSKAMQGRG